MSQHLRIGSLIFVVFCGSAIGFAGEENLTDRVSRLEERLDRSEAKNRELERELAARKRTEVGEAVADYLANSAQPTPTRARAYLTFYGFIRLDLYYNTARMDSVIAPTVVLPEAAGMRDDDGATMSIRQTRIGMLFDFKQVGSLAATGVLEFDLAAQSSSSLSLLRVRLAYVQLASENWWLRLGQDWDVIAPLNPSINDESLMLLTGNVAERRAMVRWFLRPPQSSTSLDVALAASGTFSGQDLDGGGPGSELDGIDSGVPELQIRVAWHAQKDDADGHVVAIWSYLGASETDTAFGGDRNFVPWVVGIDWTIRVGDRVRVLGEAWFGEALSDIGGNIGQSINTATGGTIRGLGGWCEVDWRPSESWQFYAGMTIDDPENGNLAAGAPSRNWSAYLGGRRHVTERFRVAVGIVYWETSYQAGGLGNAVRINIWTSTDF